LPSGKKQSETLRLRRLADNPISERGAETFFCSTYGNFRRCGDGERNSQCSPARICSNAVWQKGGAEKGQQRRFFRYADCFGQTAQDRFSRDLRKAPRSSPRKIWLPTFRADQEEAAGDIRRDMFFELVTGDIVLADISILNANVFYELGVLESRARKEDLCRFIRVSANQHP